jgi:Ca2+-binding EF-hand superfamily protein
MKAAFNYFDANGDGRIGRDELNSVVRKIGVILSDDELDELIKQIDKNGDGKIEFNGKAKRSKIFLFFYIRISLNVFLAK